MANLNLTGVEQAIGKLLAPMKKATAATGRFRDQLGETERAARNLSERKSGLSRRFTGATSRIAAQNRELRVWGGVTRGALGGTGGLATAAHKIGLGLVGVGYAAQRGIVDSAVSFERFRTALEKVEGAGGKARASMDWISNFAVKTPFELEQVTDAFVKLRSDGMDPTDGLLRTLGDASAAAGKPLTRAVEAMTGAVSGDNRGLAEFDIEARAVEGGKIRYEYEVGGETKIAEAMAADGAQIRQVLGGIFDIKFGGAMAEESKTFMGMLGNLADQWARFRNLVMASGLFDWLTGRLGRLLDTLDRMAASGELQQWAKRVGDGLITAFQYAGEIGRQLWPVVTGIAGAIGKAANAVGGFGNLLWILGGLGTAKKLWTMTESIRGLGSEALQAAGGPRQLTKRLTTFTLTAGKAAGVRVRQLSKRLTAFTLAAGKAAGGAIKSFGASLASFAATGATAAIAGLKGLIVSTWTWTAALLANPITWVVAAVAGAAALIYKYWEPLSGFFIRLWGSVRVGAVAAWEWIKGVWNTAAEWFGSLSLAEMGKALLATLGEGIRAGAAAVWEPLQTVLGKVREMLPFSDARRGPLSKLTASGASILDTMGLGVLRAGPDALRRPLARTLGAAAAGGFSSEALRLPAPAALPGFPSRAASPPGGAPLPSQIDNSIHIQQLTVHQQPGEDAVKLAERLLREIEYRREVNRRAALYDEL
ncbi:MAG: tape measure protein [Bryobacterales bacterium]|nr:tape measure protein [Bryobacterales bacterium]MDE0296957.1 tape measure protein [Bryobacterales bacterium]